MKSTLLVIAMLVIGVGCKRSGPSLKETTDWMQQAVAFHSADAELMLTPDGTLGEIPEDQVNNAFAAGGRFPSRTARVNPSAPSVTLDMSTAQPIVKVPAKLTADGCKLTYLNQWNESAHYDLSEIDPEAIKLNNAGNSASVWVEFRKTNTADGGHFWLNSEYAQSFAKALKHAAILCDGKPSLF
jgi:hypothetical protein